MHLLKCLFFILQAFIISTIAEYSLPMSIAPVFLETAQILSQDRAALSKVCLSRAACSYKLKYGLAHHINESNYAKLREHPFSLNIDEATSKTHKKVLGMLACYCDHSEGRIKVLHLKSIEVAKSNNTL